MPEAVGHDQAVRARDASSKLMATIGSILDEKASCAQDLVNIGILEGLAQDPRPTIVLDLEDIDRNGWRVVYSNHAYNDARSDSFAMREAEATGPFRAWAIDSSVDRPTQFRQNSRLWISYDLHGRWRIVSGLALYRPSGNEASDISSPSDASSSTAGSWLQTSYRGSAFISLNPADEANWVDLLPNTPFIDGFFKCNDWANTPLGSLENWSYLLRRSSRFVLADPSAACLFWGPKYACVFNQGYGEIMGHERRSRSLGQAAEVVWPEVYDSLDTIFQEMRISRQSCSWKNIEFFIIRNGLLCETFWNWNLIPLMEDKALESGFYSTIHETTQQHVGNRRQDTMLASVHARDSVTFWRDIQANFQKNPRDAPFAAFYDVKRPRRMSQDSDGSQAPDLCMLRGSIGLSVDDDVFVEEADLAPAGPGIIPFLDEAAKARESLILSQDSHPGFFKLLAKVEWQGFQEPSKTVVIFCLRLGDEVIGFAVLGLNPRRAYDDSEHRFVDALDSHLSASLSAAALIERSIENEMRLQRRLDLSAEQIEMSDARYRAITELNPVGMINVRPNGDTVYANRMWHEITGHPPDADLSKVHFRSIIDEDDLEKIDFEFMRMVEFKETRYYEVRLKKKRFDSDTHQWEPRWLLCSGGPEYDDEGNVRSIIGCVTDITAQKRAQNLQTRSRQAAEEAKAAQEKFMDATSHEMRNPLSAILQSVDDMSMALKEAKPSDENHVVFDKDAFDTCVDATNVISLCAQHQTRIVDDVLTMSKLDSHMLEVTPVPAQPLKVVKETMQMYGGELASNKIDSELIVEPAFDECRVDWVYCDPARLKQILINLFSNAVKFTRQEATRKISVNVTASLSKPPLVQVEGIKWFPSHGVAGSERADLTQDPACGDGEIIYIGVVIKDTGNGLTEQERNKLFTRFSQANTLTHVHYGGSGLGLFISRELTEMQGGEIGVASSSGKGSAFAFYIKCRRAPPRRPSLAMRTSSGQKVAQIAGLVPDPNKQIRASQGLLPQPTGTSSSPSSSLATVMEKVTAPPSKPASLSVLVVEDNIVNQRVMTKQLIKAGCTVAIANHGQEALDYLLTTSLWSANSQTNNGGEVTRHIDVALVDIEMPVMNGLTCARRIRAHQAAGEIVRHLPLMAVTANARKEQIQECLAAGMDEVTTKPFKIKDLLARVHLLIERWRIPEEGMADLKIES